MVNLMDTMCIWMAYDSTPSIGLQILPDWQEYFGNPTGKVLGTNSALANANLFLIYRQVLSTVPRTLVVWLYVDDLQSSVWILRLSIPLTGSSHNAIRVG